MRSVSYLMLLMTGLSMGVHPAFPQTRHTAKKHAARPHGESAVPESQEVRPLEIFGMRPGLSFDSVDRIMIANGATMRSVQGEDSISRSFSDNPAHVYVVDSIICRLTYMRMAFVFDGNNRLRRLTITPRESSIAAGASDDIENVLLLYFGQGWGKPELDLSPPLPMFHWRTGNIDVRGFIRRGYPMWVLEG